MFRRTGTQGGEHALAIPTVFKGDCNVIRMGTSRKGPTPDRVLTNPLSVSGGDVRRYEVRRINLHCVDIALRINDSAVPGLRPPQATQNALASRHSPSPTGDRFVAKKRAFISFDFDHDKDLRGNLVSQAKDPNSPFRIVDMSLYERFESNWKEQVRKRIRKTDLTIVICGEHTHIAKGVAAELTITQEMGKPYFLLRGRRKRTCRKPAMAHNTDEMHDWNWDDLKRLIDGH